MKINLQEVKFDQVNFIVPEKVQTEPDKDKPKIS